MKRSNTKDLKENARQNPVSGDVPDVGSVDRIRDIIFGAQMRDYEVRFQDLEKRLLKEARELREEVGRQRQTLEKLIQDKSTDLSQKLSTESSQRQSSLRALEKAIGKVESEIAKRLTNQGGNTQKLLKGLEKKLVGRIEELTQTMKREISQLQLEKSDRQALAALLREAADSLSNNASPEAQ